MKVDDIKIEMRVVLNPQGMTPRGRAELARYMGIIGVVMKFRKHKRHPIGVDFMGDGWLIWCSARELTPSPIGTVIEVINA